MSNLHDKSIEAAKSMIENGVTRHISYVVESELALNLPPHTILKVTIEYVDEDESQWLDETTSFYNEQRG